MRRHEIKVGGLYTAKVSGNLTTVRVTDIRVNGDNKTRYDVVNLKTN